MTKLIFGIICATLSTFSCGFHQGVINAPRASISDCSEIEDNCIPMNDLEWGLFVAIFVVGGILGSLTGGPSTKRYGRTRTV
jgi:hypothetical protein